MRALIQRVRSAKVVVEEKTISSIGLGLVILLGIGHQDTAGCAQTLAEKIAHLRIFEDDAGKFNLSIQEVNGEAIVVSQFTLFANASKGRRPSFIEAARPEVAAPLVDTFIEKMKGLGIKTQSGIFGAHMLVEINNDGPVTIWLEQDD